MQAEEEPQAWQSQDELERITHWQQRARKACVRARCALGKAARVALVSALLILPARGSLGGLAAHAATTTATVDEMVDTPEDAEEQAAMASELVQRSNDGQPLVIKVVKVGGTVGVAGAGIAYALKSKAEADAAKKREADEYLQQLMASESKSVGLPSFLDELTPDAPSALATTPGSLQAAAAAASVAAPTPNLVAPPAAPTKPAEEPKRLGLNLFKKQAIRHVPTVDELTAAGTPEAALCKTIAWALRAPIDIATVGLESASAETIDEDGPMALALSILEELEVARNASLAAGLDDAQIATCLEDVARAMLLQNVDAAVKVVESSRKGEFEEAAARLCFFAQNAEAVASQLAVAPLIGEVLYEGTENKRRLERLYLGCLQLAAPELLSTMGMGMSDTEDDGAPAGVGLDTVEKLRPVLKVKEAKGQRMVQDVMQKQMMDMMGDQEPGNEGKAMERSVAMIEQLIDSGSIQPSDLAQLKEMISSSMGMPVEELLRRKDELQAELPPEGKKLFTLIERLFGEGASSLKSAGGSDMGSRGANVVDPADDLDDENVKVTVRAGALPTPVSSIPIAPPADVKISVKKSSSPPAAASPSPPVPAAAPPSDVAVAAEPPSPPLDDRIQSDGGAPPPGGFEWGADQ